LVRDTPSSAATCKGVRYSAAVSSVRRAFAVERLRWSFATAVRNADRARWYSSFTIAGVYYDRGVCADPKAS
jgi:hypothetical protein